MEKLTRRDTNMDIKIEPIVDNNRSALKLKNEPFQIIGDLNVVKLSNKWCYNINFYAASQSTSQIFPQENYQLSEINATGFALGAFTQTQPVGLAVFRKQLFKYLYLDDLKVNVAYRHQAIAQKLLLQACQLAKKAKYAGIFTICQNNNLNACLFYLSFGFRIGGLNTKVYDHTSQSGKADIYFYYDF
ncbi:GNAT family N-acetyltransferase [Ligilactobacillus acidipiscis]|jgi:ribosomal protein S18 acetylase RimI-like enzyme|uniref:GNAT family N-acetyltransferase n=1 Tax=Ligilactobacillus acidipiscis TaxID=89059 RepID=UPI002FD9CD1E